MKVWVTKYAMTGKGVIPCEEARDQVDGDMAVIPGNCETGRLINFLHGDEWHLTPEAAIARAEEMRTKKIALLKKKITKLEAMVFTAEEQK